MNEVIEELEAIVSSGTRVNIGYYIDDILDPENQEEIFDYFSEAETDDLITAYKEFDGDYNEEELRLMRIKFMSEMANWFENILDSLSKLKKADESIGK